jgi:hypothetical protein
MNSKKVGTGRISRGNRTFYMDVKCVVIGGCLLCVCRESNLMLTEAASSSPFATGLCGGNEINRHRARPGGFLRCPRPGLRGHGQSLPSGGYPGPVGPCGHPPRSFLTAAEVEAAVGRKLILSYEPDVEPMKNFEARDLILGTAVTLYVA